VNVNLIIDVELEIIIIPKYDGSFCCMSDSELILDDLNMQYILVRIG